jgi:16S rRNA G966 N2-methylase RsmD
MSDHLFQLSDEFQVMPPLSDEEYEALKSDIAVNGVEDPIVHDEEMTVIDGHHRIRACRELDIDIETVPTQSVVGLSHQEKRDKAYKLNLQRRHLEHGQKKEIVDQYLLNDWDGDRSKVNGKRWEKALGKDLSVGWSTVSRRFSELRSDGKFVHLNIFTKDTKKQKVRDYIEKHPDASNRSVAKTVEPDISYNTVRNWRAEWEEDEENDTEDTAKTPGIKSYGHASDADERVENTEEIVEATTDESSPESVTETAEEVAEKVNNGETTPEEAKQEVKAATNKAEKEKKREQKQDQFREEVRDETAVNIEHGDFAKQLSGEAGQYDHIVTDPPYDEDAIAEWEKLARTAKEVLKPGGLLIAYSGKYHLPSVYDALEAELEYFWQCIVVHSGAGARVWPRNLRTNYKPVIVYAKPPVEELEGLGHDVIDGAGREKDDHEWQQATAESIDLIEQLTEPNDMILDPMCGSGTTGVAALAENRRVHLIDRDEEAVETARERCADVIQ